MFNLSLYSAHVVRNKGRTNSLLSHWRIADRHHFAAFVPQEARDMGRSGPRPGTKYANAGLSSSFNCHDATSEVRVSFESSEWTANTCRNSGLPGNRARRIYRRDRRDSNGPRRCRPAMAGLGIAATFLLANRMSIVLRYSGGKPTANIGGGLLGQVLHKLWWLAKLRVGLSAPPGC